MTDTQKNIGPKDIGGICVMVIDDDPLVRETIRNILQARDISVVEAEDGAQGLDLYRQTPVPVVITDLLMPGKEGIETIAELRRMAPELKIIAISGGGATNNLTFLELAQKIGADKTLSKPFKPRDLLNTITAVL